MAVLDNGLKGAVPSILVILGVALAAPIVLPAVAAVSRPLAKTLIKGYLTLSDMVKEFCCRGRRADQRPGGRSQGRAGNRGGCRGGSREPEVKPSA